jgi:exodeoxyribonuclease V alpha subunit
MSEKISRTIQVTSVFPGMLGGAIVKGSVVGERTELRCKIDSRIMIDPPHPGEFWKVVGEFYADGVYGQQLRVSSCEPVKLPEEKYVASLLVNHPAFKGFHFGQKKVASLLDLFGAETLVKHLNDGNVRALSQAIQLPIAIEVVKAWQNLNNEVDTINFLLSYRFSPQLARKVISLCRDNVVERLKKNPYALVCFGDISRSIWRTVEGCAVKLGISPDDENRLVGAVEHVLYESLRQGHTAMSLSELVRRVEILLKSKEWAERGVLKAVKRRVACVLNQQPEPLIQLYGPAVIEQQLEKRIEALLSGPKQMTLFSNDDAQLERLIEEYCARVATADFWFNDRQKSAIFMALTSRISVLTGFGGTGKTTVLRAIIEIAKLIHRETHLLALAGKAKERARQATGHRAFTIHAFLGAVKKGAEDIKLDGNPLIIIDEASMVDVALFNELLSVMDGKRFSLLTVGDTEQISPVGFGLVWHRLAALSEIPTVHLTEVHRQQSTLHDAAMAVRGAGTKEGDVEIPEWKGEDEGVYLVPATAKDLHKKLLLLKSLESERKLPEAQILTPYMTERMTDSGIKINRYLQKELTGGKPEIWLGSQRLIVGDPVIVSENNYDLGLFNGTTGRFLNVTTKGDMLAGVFTLEGQEGEVTLSTDELYDVGMKPAYAISIHKSQGSEYNATMITCIQNSPMLERSLIYTALTRAKKLCLVVGSLEVFQCAVKEPSRADTLCAGFFLSRLNLGSSKPS